MPSTREEIKEGIMSDSKKVLHCAKSTMLFSLAKYERQPKTCVANEQGTARHLE